MAENGVTGIFMVSSVMAVPMVGKTKRDPARTYGHVSKDSSSAGSFVRVFDQAMEEQIESAPTECHTVTYGRDSKIQHFLYQTREYHY